MTGLDEFVAEACRVGPMCMGSVVDVSAFGVLQHSSAPPPPKKNLGAILRIVSLLNSQIALFSSSECFHIHLPAAHRRRLNVLRVHVGPS